MNINVMNITNGKKFYVAEVVGSRKIKVTKGFVFLADAEEAKRRIRRNCKGNYVIEVA